jgi:hypothetical protein
MAVPAAPTALVATPAQTSISVAFAQVAATPAIDNYEVKIGSGAWTALTPADAASPIVVSGLENGRNYTLYLRAVNADGVSPSSAKLVTGTTNDPTDDKNGFTNASPFANAGSSVHHLDFNDPDD